MQRGSEGAHPACPPPRFFHNPNLCTVLTAIRASFGEKKLRAQEEPKSLPPDAFPGLQICQNCFWSRGFAPDPTGGAYSAPPDPLAGLELVGWCLTALSAQKGYIMP